MEKLSRQLKILKEKNEEVVKKLEDLKYIGITPWKEISGRPLSERSNDEANGYRVMTTRVDDTGRVLRVKQNTKAKES